jgi:hypothetical protein
MSSSVGVGHWSPRPGDIVLFGVHHTSFASRTISRLTNSNWTHSAILCSGMDITEPGLGWVADDDPQRRRILLFETTARFTDRPMLDYTTGRSKAGIRVVDAFQRVREKCVDEGCRTVVRRFTDPTTVDEVAAACLRVARNRAGGRYEWNPLLLADAVFAPSTPSSSGRKEAVLARRNSMFCSQLVAEVLIEARVLPPETTRPARTYLPRDFIGDEIVPGLGLPREVVFDV